MPKRTRALRHRLAPAALQLLLWLSASLPLRASHALGSWFGWLAWRLGGKSVAITERNLALCFPEMTAEQHHQLARSSFIETGKTLMEVGALWRWPRQKIMQLVVEVSGRELIDEATATGQGVIIAAPHLGAWEMIGLYWSVEYPITSLYRPPRLAAINEPVHRGREHLGATLVPTDAGGVRALLKALKQGQIAGILPDQEPPRDAGGVFAPFFGTSAWTITLLTRLAQKSGARVVFSYAERLPKGRGFHIHVLPAPQDIADQDPERAAAALNRGVEQCVRQLPHQYQWSYMRFRKRPAGEQEIY